MGYHFRDTWVDMYTLFLQNFLIDHACKSCDSHNLFLLDVLGELTMPNQMTETTTFVVQGCFKYGSFE